MTLLGMTGAGKSHWAKRLEQQGYLRISIDDQVEAKLAAQLVASGYSGGIRDVSKWMGQPYDPQYPRHSQAYLDAEADALKEVLATVRNQPGDKNMVIDTTGSLVYMPRSILDELSQRTTMVYLHTPESARKHMVSLYLQDPKPVYWGDAFRQLPNETPKQALARCYPELLRKRTALYEQLAHVTLDYHQLRSGGMSAQAIADMVAS